MKEFSRIQMELLSFLEDGDYHTGNALGLQLGVTRTAVWKQMTQLHALGVPIQRSPQRGYRIANPMMFLNAKKIDHELERQGFKKNIRYHIYASIDSTNRWLKDLPTSDAIDVCCAEMQTAGRGRFNRPWFSPFGENIYLSSRWHFNGDLSSLSGLSLVVSLAVLNVLHDQGIKEHLRVKWPNDLLWLNKKLSGNLIEIIAESNGGADIVIGIGLNVNSLSEMNESVLQPTIPWCSVREITGSYHDRNRLIAALINRLDHDLTRFMVQGFEPFIPTWNQVDFLKEKRINVSHPNKRLSGTAAGVDHKGQLILIDENQVTHYLSSGDTSLHSSSLTT